MGRRDKPLPGGAIQTLGAQLRGARQAAGIRSTQQAAALGYSKGYVSAIERGLQWPGRRFVEHYVQALQLDPTPWLEEWGRWHDVHGRAQIHQQQFLQLLHRMVRFVPKYPQQTQLTGELHQIATAVAHIDEHLVLRHDVAAVEELVQVMETLKAVMARLLIMVELPPASVAVPPPVAPSEPDARTPSRSLQRAVAQKHRAAPTRPMQE